MMKDNNEEQRKKEIIKKVNLFTQLLEELSGEIASIYTEGHEKTYHEIIIKMLESLDAAQTTVRKAYNMALGRDISTN